MTCYIISYDLTEGSDYDSLHNAIKSYGTCTQISESTWAIVTDSSATAIRDKLGAYMQKGGRLFVVKSGIEAAWRNVICKSEWLQKHL